MNRRLLAAAGIGLAIGATGWLVYTWNEGRQAGALAQHWIAEGEDLLEQDLARGEASTDFALANRAIEKFRAALGVLGEDQSALFLNPSEAAVSGDAVCEPSPEQCQRVKLGAGQSATLAAQAIDGSLSEYQLDIDAITPVQADTAEEAKASRNRESKAGRVVLRRLVTEVGSLVGDLTFAGDKGVVEPAPAE